MPIPAYPFHMPVSRAMMSYDFGGRYHFEPGFAKVRDVEYRDQHYPDEYGEYTDHMQCLPSVLPSSLESPQLCNALFSMHQHHYYHLPNYNTEHQRSARSVYCKHSSNILNAGSSSILCPVFGKYYNWQSVWKLYESLAVKDIIQDDRLAESHLNVQMHPPPPYNSHWMQNYNFLAPSPKMCMENSHSVAVPNPFLVNYRLKSPPKYPGRHSDPQPSDFRQLCHSEPPEMKQIVTFQQPNQPIMPQQFLGTLPDQNQYSSTETNAHQMNVPTLESTSNDRGTYLTESELDSLVSRIAEEATNFVPVWSSTDKNEDSANENVNDSNKSDVTTPEKTETRETQNASNKVVKPNRRKQARPQCSAKKDDPKFRGVIVEMQMKRENRQCKLKLKSSFNLKLMSPHLKGSRRLSCCTRDHVGTTFIANPGNDVNCGKNCVSCGAKKASSWTEWEQGKRLCNNCNTRYKKHGVRCGRCWHIPKNFVETHSKCGSCGSSLYYFLIKQTTIQCKALDT